MFAERQKNTLHRQVLFFRTRKRAAGPRCCKQQTLTLPAVVNNENSLNPFKKFCLFTLCSKSKQIQTKPGFFCVCKTAVVPVCERFLRPRQWESHLTFMFDAAAAHDAQVCHSFVHLASHLAKIWHLKRNTLPVCVVLTCSFIFSQKSSVTVSAWSDEWTFQ